MSGLMTVFKKEIADDFSSWRFIILFTLVLLAGIFAIYVAAQNIRSAVTGSTEFVFLALYTTSGESMPSFLFFVMFLLPIVGIALGFDAINGEKNAGTLSRLMSQPIYRDTIINAKFLAGAVTIAVMMTAIVMLVAGVGIRMIGVPPSAEEAWRLLFFLIASIIYGSFWMGLAILFSIYFRRVATSALVSFAIWIFFLFFITVIAGGVANSVSPPGDTIASQAKYINLYLSIFRISPTNLFQEAMGLLLVPGGRTLSQLFQLQTGAGAFLVPNPLSFTQSLLEVWPHLVTLIVLTVICFAISYVRFMKEEIRA